ncbi:MAG: hypothetical protein AB7K04_12520, partial [Pseudorhodoplanes sp.]
AERRRASHRGDAGKTFRMLRKEKRCGDAVTRVSRKFSISFQRHAGKSFVFRFNLVPSIDRLSPCSEPGFY